MKGKRFYQLILFAVLLFAVSSCTIHQELQINLNGSGRIETRLDMSGLKGLSDLGNTFSNESNTEENAEEMIFDPLSVIVDTVAASREATDAIAEEMDTVTIDGNDLKFDFADSVMQGLLELKRTLEAIPGISNVVVSADENFGYSSAYSFMNIGSLMQAQQAGNEQYGQNFNAHNCYKKSKKVFVMKFCGDGYDKLMNDTENPEMMQQTIDMMQGMPVLFQSFLTITFEQKIRKCSNAHFVISDDRHSLIYEGSFAEVLKDPHILDMEVRLK